MCWPDIFLVLGAGAPSGDHSDGPSGMRIALGLATLVALALIGSNRKWWSWRRSPIGAAISAGGWLMVGVGLLLGPHVVGLIDASYVDVLRPLVLFCLGWVGMMIGLQLRRDLPKLLPAGSRTLAAVDALGSFIVVAGGVGLVLWLLLSKLDGAESVQPLAVIIVAVLLAACSVGWSSEMRSLVGTDPDLAPTANLLRAASGLAGVLTLMIFGLALMLVHHGDQVELKTWPLLIGLAICVLLAMVAGRMTGWMMNIGGRDESQFLVVLLGLVSFVAGAAATMGYSPLFVAMLCGVVVVNLPGNILKRFQRVIVDAEQPVAMVLMLTAGVIADPLLGVTGWVVIAVVLAIRFVFKLLLTRRPLAQAHTSHVRRMRFAAVRQAPLAVALAVGFAVSSHDLLTQSVFNGGQLVMIVVVVGLVSEAATQLHRLTHGSTDEAPQDTSEAAT